MKSVPLHQHVCKADGLRVPVAEGIDRVDVEVRIPANNGSVSNGTQKVLLHCMNSDGRRCRCCSHLEIGDRLVVTRKRINYVGWFFREM